MLVAELSFLLLILPEIILMLLDTFILYSIILQCLIILLRQNDIHTDRYMSVKALKEKYTYSLKSAHKTCTGYKQ